jgi:hypothetical protein
MRLLTQIMGENAICGLQRIKESILVRFEPTNLRIVYLKELLKESEKCLLKQLG